MEVQQSTDDIFKALMRSDTEAVKTFIINNVDLNAKNERGNLQCSRVDHFTTFPIFTVAACFNKAKIIIIRLHTTSYCSAEWQR
jgi:hypothetical protein